MGCGAQVAHGACECEDEEGACSAGEAFLEFYRGNGVDNKGRTIEEIWSWDDARLESGHDYIQWLFPSDEPSQFNKEAPRFSSTVAKAFKNEPEIMANFFRSFSMFMNFLGLRYDEETKSIARNDDFMKKAKNWLRASTTGPNHNWLRCSRVLHCLKLLGEFERRDAFYNALEQIYVDGLINSRFKSTIKHWQEDGGIEGRPIPKQPDGSHTELIGTPKSGGSRGKGLKMA